MERENELRADYIEVTVKGGFKTEHVFQSPGGVLGVLKLNAMITKGTFQDGEGTVTEFKVPKVMKAYYEIDQEGATLGSAKPVKKLGRALALEFGGESYTLGPEKMLSRTWRLLDGQGSSLCELKPRGALKRGAVIQIHYPVELVLLMFAYCLVTKRWQEESAAASA